MDTRDVDFIKLLPFFMREDEADKGLSKGIDKAIDPLSDKIDLFTTWDKLDKMTGEEIDLLAEELHISWYDKDTTLDIKRQIIRDSDIVHAKLGTNWAALQVITTYFGEGKIVDWYDYGGNPGHFKVQTINQSILNSKAKKFLSILEKVKRKSAHLDAIELISDGWCGLKIHIGTVETEICASFVNREVPKPNKANLVHLGNMETEICASIVNR